MADTDFITRHDAQVEYCKPCGMCKTPGKKENVENACIQSFPAKNPILEIPAADVRPVARGKWKHDGSDWKNRFICDQCGYKWFFEAEEAHFCPNCGCAMENEK